MKQESKDYIKRLRETYEPFAAIRQGELDILTSFEKDDELSSMLMGYRDHPITEKMLTNAIGRFKDYARKLLTDRTLSNEERTACFVGMDWAKWYIDIASVDGDKIRDQIDNEVLEMAKGAGIAQ